MITKNLGMLLLAIYLILVGIMALVHFAIPRDRHRNSSAAGRDFDSHRQVRRPAQKVRRQSRIFLATEPVDFRKGIDGLAAVCRQALGEISIR